MPHHPHDSANLLDWPRPSIRSSDNQRACPRATAPFSVQAAGRATWEGINLSEGGMLCRAAQPWWPGNEVALELQLPTETVTVRGRVAELVDYQGEIAMRVCFAGVGSHERSAIARWVAQRKTPASSVPSTH